MTGAATTFAQSFFHGTKADLKPGDLVAPGFASNFGARAASAHVYCAATLDAAIWGAELTRSDGAERIYVVEPTGPLEDDPDLTDRKFPGNPTLSYRSSAPLRVLGEIVGWTGHSAERLAAMRASVARVSSI